MRGKFNNYSKTFLVILMVMLMCTRCILITTYAAEETNEDIVNSGEYIEINENVLNMATTEESEENVRYLSDLSELYGDDIVELSGLSYEEIVSCVLVPYYGVSGGQEIRLGKRIDLFDANNVNTYVGYNYYINNTDYGYITVATHTKATLVKDIVENELLPEDKTEMYYLSSEEFYFLNNGNYFTLDGVEILKDEFESFLEDRKMLYYNLTLNLLADLELNTISQLNNLIYIENGDFQESSLGKSYKGQTNGAYGYGGITDCTVYLKDRYGGTITLTASKYLSMSSFLMRDLERINNNSVNNCTLTAVTRVLYYYNQKGYKKIDSNYYDIYAKVRKAAVKYGYSPSKGVGFTKINNIVDDVLHNYGYKKGKCKGIYIWTFDKQVKKEIDGNHPVIMNIARGYYGNHTVTVCGYAIYKRSGGWKHNMIQVYDGWDSTRRYIDYEAFANDLITSGFGSFNTIRMK